MRKKILVDGKETNYEISDMGEVFNLKTNRQLKGTYARNEYHSVQLTIEGKPKSFMTHRLVANAFIPNPNNYLFVDHINRDKHDNRAENLRWVSHEENMKNRTTHIEKRVSDLTPEQIKEEEWTDLPIDSNYAASKNGYILNKKTNYIIKGSDRNGYKRITLKGKVYSIHRIIWELFNGSIPEGQVIDHIDGNRSNNALSNLRMVSQSENMNNAQKNGHKGQKVIYQYDSTGKFIKKYLSIQEAADAMRVTHAAVRSASQRKGTCKGYYWIKEEDLDNISEIIKK